MSHQTGFQKCLTLVIWFPLHSFFNYQPPSFVIKPTPIDSKAQEMLNKVQQVRSSPKISIITDKRGEVLEMVVNGQMGKIVELSELTYFAKVIAMRYDVADYHKILDGLLMDIGFSSMSLHFQL